MKWVLRVLGGLLLVLIAAFFIFRVPDTDPEEMWAKYGAAPSQRFELADGRTVHLRDEGPRDAPAIVLLHGSNADLATWQPWVERLREDYRVIRFDQRGHGLTGPAPDNDYSLAAFVADVDRVADALDLDRFVLAGNSMGGGIAMGYAIAHPERLRGLVLVDAGGAPIRRERGGNLAFTVAAMPVVGDAASQVLPRSLVARSLSQSVSNHEVVTPQAIDRYWEMARYPGNRGATRARFSTRRVPFTPEQIAEVEVPTLVMWGKEDALIPYAAAGWYMDHLPQATLAAYPAIGHLPMEEAPDRSAQDLRQWLDSLTTGGNPDPAEPAQGPSVLNP
ncbi:alpha/beta hydrolase [Qipengyuania sp. XHP0207]|uniref:alpha/beta fold hydrolase n=1 Tax=Qipengyuania sp. XHP0207 TaxID=3038078 RepID=UPI0024202B37|nr:alpha/beta hydrolase [Qipengyuania sp. XHP0207]MDG5748845.1 alpha/beta hydrolase [Qipengyuania sp. XHP0207]